MIKTNKSQFDHIDLTGVKGVLIDLDDTLYRYEPCHDAGLATCFEHHTFGLSVQAFQTRYRAARDLVSRTLAPQGASRSRLFAFMAMAEEANTPQGYALAFQLDEIYWKTFIDAMVMDLGALAFLTRCSDAKIKTCIVTDMTAHIQIRKIAQLGVGPYIDRLVTSEEVGAEKPNCHMFWTAAQKLGISVNACIMLGDSAKKDVEGAMMAGMTGYLIKLSEVSVP